MMTRRQADLFAIAAAPVVPETPDPDAIRMRLHAVLALMRNACEVPWEASRARVQEHLFINMAAWLPPEERDTLRREFAEEMRRLRLRG